MEYLSIGFVIGVVLGLTGSGGALVAIPLFMLLGLDIKEASFLSLTAVVLAGMVNLVHHYKNADLKKSLLMISASLIGSFLFIPIKELTPNIVILLLLTAISFYSLWMMWQPSKKASEEKTDESILLPLIVGGVLGALTTLTGLGGGVLLMPVFLGVFKMPMARALATSLLTIVGSSFISFCLQWYKGASIPGLEKLALLMLGIVASSFLLKMLVARLSENKADLFRRIVFSGIVLFAMVKFYF